jgi:hypothetical protein
MRSNLSVLVFASSLRSTWHEKILITGDIAQAECHVGQQ